MSTTETTGDAGVFSNENISVTVTKLPYCNSKFEVTVQPQAVEAAYLKAVKNIKKEVTVPGFRKGKAPDHFIFSGYESSIDKEWKDILLQTGFNEALHLAQLSPLKNGYISRPTIHECSKENGAKFTVEFESKPSVPSVDFKEIQVKKSKRAGVTEKDRENALHNFALQFTTYEPIEDRATLQGDFANLSVDLIEDGNARRIIDNQRPEVGDKGLPSWILNKVIGLKGGESAEGYTEQESGKEDPDYKSVPFRVTVESLSKGEMPAFDDTLAEKAGLKTLEELKNKINEGIEKNIEEDAASAEYKDLLRQLSEKYSFDLPLSIIEGNVETRLNEYKEAAAAGKNGASKENIKEVEKLLKSQIENELRLVFLFRKTATEHGIEVTQEDIRDELNRQIALISSGRSAINFQGDQNEMRERLHNLALDRKIKNFILEQVTFIEE